MEIWSLIRNSKGLRPADTVVSGGDEQFEVDGGIGVVILLTSSDSEAPFEDNIGTYLSKRGGLAKLGSLIGLSYDLTDIQLSAEIFFGCPICFCSPTTEGQGSRHSVLD